jgi:hypothetical protein
VLDLLNFHSIFDIKSKNSFRFSISLSHSFILAYRLPVGCHSLNIIPPLAYHAK